MLTGINFQLNFKYPKIYLSIIQISSGVHWNDNCIGSPISDILQIPPKIKRSLAKKVYDMIVIALGWFLVFLTTNFLLINTLINVVKVDPSSVKRKWLC